MPIIDYHAFREGNISQQLVDRGLENPVYLNNIQAVPIPIWQIVFEAVLCTIGLFILAKFFWMIWYELKEKDGGMNYLRYGKEFFKK